MGGDVPGWQMLVPLRNCDRAGAKKKKKNYKYGPRFLKKPMAAPTKRQEQEVKAGQ